MSTLSDTVTGKRPVDPKVTTGRNAPILDGSKLEVLGRAGGRGPQYAVLADHEYTVREKPSWRSDDELRSGVVLLGRMLTERGADGRPARRRQIIEATEVPVGTFKKLQAAHERAEAARAAKLAGSTTPRYTDMLALLPALQGRPPSIIPLGPIDDGPVRLDEAVEQFNAKARLDELGVARRTANLVTEEETPKRGLDAAWHYLTARRGIVFRLTKSGRLALPASHIAYQDREVIETIGIENIENILKAKGFPLCDLDHGKRETPVAFTVAWPNRLPICEEHLVGGLE